MTTYNLASDISAFATDAVVRVVGHIRYDKELCFDPESGYMTVT